MPWPCPSTPPVQYMWYIQCIAALRPQKMLNPGKGIEGRSSFASGAPQEVLESIIFTPFFLLDGKQQMVYGSLWLLTWELLMPLRHYLPSLHASRPWCAAVEEAGGDLENITQVKTLGKVRNRLGYDPTRTYIYFRIFWGQLPEFQCSEPDWKEVKKTVWDMDITHLLPSGCKALSLLFCPHHRYVKPLNHPSAIDSWYCIYLIIKKCAKSLTSATKKLSQTIPRCPKERIVQKWWFYTADQCDQGPFDQQHSASSSWGVTNSTEPLSTTWASVIWTI